jgi:hypothetical protein
MVSILMRSPYAIKESCNMNAFFSFDLFMVYIPECKQNLSICIRIIITSIKERKKTERKYKIHSISRMVVSEFERKKFRKSC